MMLFLTGWLVCGVVAAGFCYGYFQRGWPQLADELRRRDTMIAFIFILLGYGGMVAVLVNDGTKRGWLLPGLKP